MYVFITVGVYVVPSEAEQEFQYEWERSWICHIQLVDCHSGQMEFGEWSGTR